MPGYNPMMPMYNPMMNPFSMGMGAMNPITQMN